MKKILGCGGPGWEVEGEAGFQEPAGDDTAAFQYKLGLGAHCQGTEFQHPLGGGQPDTGSGNLAKHGHEFLVRERVGSGEVYGPVHFRMVDEVADGADEVLFVDPGDVLAAVAVGAAEAAANEGHEDVKDSAWIWTHDHGGAEEDFTGVRSGLIISFIFPLQGDVVTEAPGFGDVVMGGAEDARCFVVGSVIAVGVDCGGAHLKPESWGTGGLADGFADGSGGVKTGGIDCFAIGYVVAAVDGASGEVDDEVCLIDL